MNVTLSVEDELVRKVRKIAVERDTTLTGLTHDFLEDLAAEDMAAGRKRRERAALDQSFERFAFKVGKRTSKRADLYIGLLTSWTPTFSSTTMIRRIGPYLLLRIIALTPHTASTLPKGSIGTVTGWCIPVLRCKGQRQGCAILPLVWRPSSSLPPNVGMVQQVFSIAALHPNQGLKCPVAYS